MAYKLFRLSGALLTSALCGIFVYIWTTLSRNMLQAGEQLGGVVVGLLAAAFGFGLVRNLWRAVADLFATENNEAQDRQYVGPQAPEQFKPEEALARYIAKRKVDRSPNPAQAEPDATQPALRPKRPQFGRKHS